MKAPSVCFFIGYFLFVVSPAFGSKCFCPNRNQIELSEDYNRAILTSPRYPRPYCGRLDCEWRIAAPANTSLVRFAAPNIDLRLHRDYIFFYDGTSQRPVHNCTGRMKSCEYVFTGGSVFMVKFKTGKGTVDKYGFQATITLFDDEFQSLSEDEEDVNPKQKSSGWNFFVWIVLVCIIVFIIFGILYWVCKRRRTREENRSPLLDKSSKRGEDTSVHISLNSPDEINEAE